ncbi:Rieske 2Fe-2S domain-containing protein [Streptomyces sp. NPDC001584]|uniref:Rieske (2Fe-2S) protein n=1 Tax=Streptomyces sp. NPDC001584 TaxID=3154521 RepID=UPI0033312FDF
MVTISFASDAERNRLLEGDPGTRVAGTSGGESYTVVKANGGGYVAVNRMCPHLGRIEFSGERGSSNGEWIKCSLHTQTWSLKTGEGVDQYDRALPIEGSIKVLQVLECDGEFSISTD